MPAKKTNVAIIGSGPAGYTAALYTGRANLEPFVFEGNAVFGDPTSTPGGQLMITTDVENYPGFPEGILGPALMEKFREQAKRFGGTYVEERVTELDLSKRPFRLRSESHEVEAKAIIISTGARAKLLGLPSELECMQKGYGVSACATCDGPLFRNLDIVVVGGGDTAMEEAMYLTRFASKVMVVHRRDELRASKIMQERAKKNPKIEFLWNKQVVEILDPAKKAVEAVRLEDTKSGEVSEVPCRGVFIAIGHEPATELFKDKLELDDKGYLLMKKNTMTSVEGVFSSGDVTDHRYRQAVTAAGMGCMAAIDVERWLDEQGV
jgi:thioredoxin reductase (NADPH)